MKREQRNFFGLVRSAESQGEKIIEGHAAVFEQAEIIGREFIEVIERGAFDGCDLSDVALFVNHVVTDLPLARTPRTLTVTIDEVGLKIRAKLDVANNQSAASVYSAVQRGDCRGMSFGFTVAEDEWQELNSEMPRRIIHKIGKVYEVSAVTAPAYEGTDVVARAKETLKSAKKELKNLEYSEFQRLMKRYEEENQVDERTAAIKAYEEELRRRDELIAKGRSDNPPKFWRVEDASPKFIPGKGFIPAEERAGRYEPEVRSRIQAGEDLKERRTVESTFDIFGEKRAMTLTPSGGAEATLVVPNYASEKISEDFPVVSSLVDSVAHMTLHGGDSFKQPYITGIESGNYSQEGEDYNEAETVFDYAQINRTKITAYAELTEELEKLPSAAYADVVFQNIRASIRKKLTREILFGEGLSNNQNRIVGIFSDKATAIDPATDLAFTQISDTTLSEILYRYGGDEQIESASCLVLSKLDLLAFANVRTSTKMNFYDIQYNGNGVGGKINGVNFIIDSACRPLSSADTQSGEYCMCYGNLANYLLVEFSPLEVKRSDDYKFRKGITCFKGSAICGGNVIRHNGFIRIRRK